MALPAAVSKGGAPHPQENDDGEEKGDRGRRHPGAGGLRRAGGMARLSQWGDCRSPLFVQAFAGPDAAAVAALIQRAGGLPKSDAEVLPGGQLPAAVAVFPVAEWDITGVRAIDFRPPWESIRDDDPTYGVELDIRVEYTDGERGTLRWSTWRYGLLLCPLVVGYGDGPPGRIDPLEPGGG